MIEYKLLAWEVGPFKEAFDDLSKEDQKNSYRIKDLYETNYMEFSKGMSDFFDEVNCSDILVINEDCTLIQQLTLIEHIDIRKTHDWFLDVKLGYNKITCKIIS